MARIKRTKKIRENAVVEPVISMIHRMTELENYKLAALDAERRNHILAIKNKTLQIEKLALESKEVQQVLLLQVERQQFKDSYNNGDKTYRVFVQGLATKYGLDPLKMSFDTEKCTLKDLREESADQAQNKE